MKGFIFEELKGGAACRTYLLACPRTREALLMDPVLEHVPSYLGRLEREGLRLVLAVDTHSHEDAPSGGRELARITGCVHAGRPEGSVQQVLSEGDVLEVGDLRLLVQDTPGLTTDSLALLMRLTPPRPRLEREDTQGATIPHHAV